MMRTPGWGNAPVRVPQPAATAASVAGGQLLRRADEGPAGERLASGTADTGARERGPVQLCLDHTGQPVPGALQGRQRLSVRR